MKPAAYAPTQTEVQHAEAPAMGPLEEQLAALHRHPAQLLPVDRQEDSLVLDNEVILLDGLTRSTSVTPHSAGGVVLGFEVANGAVASHDFAVGKVRSRF